LARARKRRRLGRRLALAFLLVVGLATTGFAIWELFVLRIADLRDPTETRSLTVPDGRDGTRELVLGPKSPYWTPLSRISPHVRTSVVLSEDGRFWQHEGFDWFELRKSLERNLEEGRFARGGSTITMQLAKNLFLWSDKSLFRKALEVYLTWRLERTLEKARILELYLNVAEWGRGIYGIGEASRRYFGKHPSEIGIGEAALLAVSLPSPRRSNPGRVTPYLQRRQQELLGRVNRSG
jgi:monofunctional glycosyltransferase